MQNISKFMSTRKLHTNNFFYRTNGNNIRKFNDTVKHTPNSLQTKKLVKYGVLVGGTSVLVCAFLYGCYRDSRHDFSIEKEDTESIPEKYSRGIYKHAAMSLGITAAASVFSIRTGFMKTLIACDPRKYQSILGIGTIVSLASTMFTNINENHFLKYVSFTTFNVMNGLLIAGIVQKSSMITRAMFCASGILFVFLNLMSKHHENKYIWLEMPLYTVPVVSILSLFSSVILPTNISNTSTSNKNNNILLYGGLFVFTLFLIYNHRKVINDGEKHKTNKKSDIDHINNSLSLYINAVGVLVDFVEILIKNIQNIAYSK